MHKTVEQLKQMTAAEIKQHLMQNCTFVELIDLVVDLVKQQETGGNSKQITLSVTDYQTVMETFEKLFRIPESNGRGRKSGYSHLPYNEQVRLIVLNPRLGRGTKQLRLDTLYQRELERKRSVGEDVTEFTPPILEELLKTVTPIQSPFEIADNE